MNDMNIICNKYGLDHELVRLLVELKLDLEIHCKMKINRILHRHYFHRELKYFAEK